MITGTLLGGTIAVAQDGTLTMGASVSLHDDQLGQVGQRTIAVHDPAVMAHVFAFIEASLPALSAFAGYEITLPTGGDPAVPIVRPPVTE